MRENWNRATDHLSFSDSEVQALLSPAFPDAKLRGWSIAEGGLANTNIRVDFEDGATRSVLMRFFVREAARGEQEYALSRLPQLQGIMPQYFYFAGCNPVSGHPYVIMEWVEAGRLELIQPGADHQASREVLIDLAQSLGETLAKIHSVHFERSGFLDVALNVVLPVELGGEGLIEHSRRCLILGRGAERLGQAFTDEYFDFLKRRGGLLDNWPGKPCLAHSDFGGSNILVAGGQVKAVLDWEFAFSGNPAFDFGNLLRAPWGSDFEQTLADSYIQAGGVLPADWKRRSLMADLYSWMDFLNRKEAGVALIADARRIISDTMQIC